MSDEHIHSWSVFENHTNYAMLQCSCGSVKQLNKPTSDNEIVCDSCNEVVDTIFKTKDYTGSYNVSNPEHTEEPPTEVDPFKHVCNDHDNTRTVFTQDPNSKCYTIYGTCTITDSFTECPNKNKEIIIESAEHNWNLGSSTEFKDTYVCSMDGCIAKKSHKS